MYITHNEQLHHFETVIDGIIAFLSYQKVNERTLNYNHTIVPSQLGGRGVGAALVKYALDYARNHHLQVIASCSFVAHFIQKNPEYADLLVHPAHTVLASNKR